MGALLVAWNETPGRTAMKRFNDASSLPSKPC